MIQRLLVIMIAACILSAPAARAQQPSNATTIPADQKLVIDGRLDESTWRQTPVSSPLVWLKVRDQPTPPAQTTFKILRDNDNVYFGVTCAEPLMDQLSDQPLAHDGPVIRRDCIEIFLAPDANPMSYYQFMVSAGNTIADFYYIEGGHTGGGYYNATIQSAVFKGKNYWSAEIRIPLVAFSQTLSRDSSDTWLVNITRERKPKDELTTWAPLRASFHEATKFQPVGNMPRKAARYDLSITGLAAHLTGAESNHRWTGDLQLSVNATDATAGDYQLAVEADGHPTIANYSIKIPAGASTLTVPNCTFAALGKTNFNIRLTDSTGRTIADTAYPAHVTYAPIDIVLDEPFYGNTIFPGQKIDRIRGRIAVNLPQKILDDVTLRMTLTGNDQPITCQPVNGGAAINFNASHLSAGEYPLHVEVLRDDLVIAEKTLAIRKLAPPPGSCVYIDSSRRLVVDGRPIYVRGWYGGNRFLISQALLNQFGDNAPNSKFVNAWDCQLSMEAERIDRREATSDHVRKDMKPSEKVFEMMRWLIESHRDSKTLWWYYLCDEPECRGISPVYLKYQYDFIKKLDPYRPVMIITREPALYTGCADILNPHPYLNPTVNAQDIRSMKSPKRIRNEIRTVLTAGKGKIPAWFCCQAFSYGATDPQARYPNFTEYRCMMWTAAANGATGYTPFIYNRHFNSPDLRVGCDFVYESMTALDLFLNSAQPPLATSVEAPQDGVDVRAIRVNGQVLLMAVNLLDQPVAANIQINGIDGVTQLFGFRESTDVQLSQGQLMLQFAPYQVHLLTSEKMGSQLRTITEAQKQIDALRASLKKPGNLLFGRDNEIECDSSDTYMSGRSVTQSLTDGWCDTFGWGNWRNRDVPAWLELQFPKFIPTFRTLKIYTATIEDAELYIWKDGEWRSVAQVKDNHDPVITFQLDQPTRTVKLKILITKVHPKELAEIYEIEMYE